MATSRQQKAADDEAAVKADQDQMRKDQAKLDADQKTSADDESTPSTPPPTTSSPTSRRAVGDAPLKAGDTPGPAPGTPEHVAAGGTYPSVDQPATEPDPNADPAGMDPNHPGKAWPGPQEMLDEIAEHARTTHGLAVDKAMFQRIHAYLSYHLNKAGFVEPQPAA